MTQPRPRKPRLTRAQKVVAQLLRADPRLEGVTVVTWVPDIDYRDFPMIQLRRIGGTRNPKAPLIHNKPVIEMSAYTNAVSEDDDAGLIECEDLYETALEVLYECVEEQRVAPAGYLSSLFETMGATQFGSLFQDSWRVQGLIRFGVRRPRSTT